MRFLLLLFLAVFHASGAAAIVVRFEPDFLEVTAGSSFEVDLVADIDLTVLGFGLDLDLSGVVLEAAPVIGPAWIPVEVPEGDGVAGVVFPRGILGEGVLLARLALVAGEPGTARLSTGVTLGDLTEGFPLEFVGGFGFASFESATIQVTPIPEPGTALLCAAGLALLAGADLSRRRRGRARR